MKFLIAGLGNLGAEYAHTRHNIGFDILDNLAVKEGITFTTDRYADVAEYKHKGKTFVLIKPNTYMNLSGKAVRYWMQASKLTPNDILVITDDLALPTGKIRIRAKGSDGGHNGLKNIKELLATDQYPRMRFGVGNDFGKGHQVDYVLGRWKEEESPIVQESIYKAIEAIQAFGTIGLERTMNIYNSK